MTILTGTNQIINILICILPALRESAAYNIITDVKSIPKNSYRLHDMKLWHILTN